MIAPKMCCIDLETTGLDWTARILTVAIAYRDEGGQVCSKVWAVGMEDLLTARSPIPLVRHELSTIIAQCDYVVGHNMTFDLSYGYRDHLLDSNQGKNKNNF